MSSACLYPEIMPYRVHQLTVGHGHQLYVEESGNPDGLAVLFLHGGPGGGSSPYHRRFFNPQRYRIILFDQRGCGQSTPHADVSNNTSRDLLEDIECIRRHLGVERWVLFGGSWGAALALIYAQAFPGTVLAMILRGVFLCRDQDIRWFYQYGASEVYPDAWEQFIAPVPEALRTDMLTAYHSLLMSDDPSVYVPAAKAWAVWEATAASLNPDKNLIEHFANTDVALALARIENHYFVNACFLQENQIIANLSRITDIPAIIVHGRHDMVCPLTQAWALNSEWRKAALQIIENAGHAATEPGITEALVEAADEMLLRFG